ncbi:AraC family transcriptional regulator [Pararhodobacter sp.]|jgi:AraC family transcriptional regulator|uniref:AraC family transcriptional regulator n=1 Tax=Pararhodobacter sp. TaxID=2127056 RepID=UPI002FDCCC90
MQETVTPDRLPEWVPGKVLLSSDGLNWRNVSLRTYHYQGQDVIVPALSDSMLVSYRGGVTRMRRRFEGAWKKETLGPGATSLLTRAQQAHWTWDAPLVVTHLYLAPSLLTGIAGEAMDCHVASVELADVLRADDPLLTSMVQAIASEASQTAMGGALYVESLSRALGVHLLRRYATIRLPAPRAGQRLSPGEMRRIGDYIEEQLAEPLTLEGMAARIGMTTDLFTRRFRASFGMPPYRYVTARRVARARQLLMQGQFAVKEVAALCGFADQAHLTRIYSRETGVTPAAFRKSG